MPWFEVEVIGESREIYSIEAKDEDDALERWHEGMVVLSEVSSCEPHAVVECEG